MSLTADEALRVLRATGDGVLSLLWWRAEGDGAAMSVLCCGIFDMPSADVEPITRESLPVLEAACAEARAAPTDDHRDAADMLYCVAMRREMPPLHAIAGLSPALRDRLRVVAERGLP